MAGWELALVIVAVTFLMVNTVQVMISLRMMVKMDGFITKSVKVCEKLIDYSEKSIDEMFEEFIDNNKES